MKFTIALIVAALGFYASVAWAGEAATAVAPTARASTPTTSADGAGSAHAARATPAQSRQTHRPLVVPDSRTGAKSAPSVLCACVRDRHSA